MQDFSSATMKYNYIIEQCISGKTPIEIANELELSPMTVYTYIRRGLEEKRIKKVKIIKYVPYNE